MCGPFSTFVSPTFHQNFSQFAKEYACSLFSDMHGGFVGWVSSQVGCHLKNRVFPFGKALTMCGTNFESIFVRGKKHRWEKRLRRGYFLPTEEAKIVSRVYSNKQTNNQNSQGRRSLDFGVYNHNLGFITTNRQRIPTISF